MANYNQACACDQLTTTDRAQSGVWRCPECEQVFGCVSSGDVSAWVTISPEEVERYGLQ